MNYQDYIKADQKLVILQALAEQNDVCLGERLLSASLDLHGHKLPRSEVRDRLQDLEQLGAITLANIQDTLIATLTQTGLDHVERRGFLDGVARPSLEG